MRNQRNTFSDKCFVTFSTRFTDHYDTTGESSNKDTHCVTSLSFIPALAGVAGDVCCLWRQVFAHCCKPVVFEPFTTTLGSPGQLVDKCVTYFLCCFYSRLWKVHAKSRPVGLIEAPARKCSRSNKCQHCGLKCARFGSFETHTIFVLTSHTISHPFKVSCKH